MTEDPCHEFVAFDLETTGLMAETDRIVEIGAVRFTRTGREIARYERLVNPERPMSSAAQSIHGISDADLAGAAKAREVIPEFIAFLECPQSTTLLAHNAAFDAGFLGRELARLEQSPPGHAVVDTLALARRQIPEARDHRLDTMARLLGLDLEGSHRALADGLRVKGLWLALGGQHLPSDVLVSYPIFDPRCPESGPNGWELLREAIAARRRVRITYAGGSRGIEPREVTPRGFALRGGVAYLVALCHLDDFEKSFRLDRVRHHEVVPLKTTLILSDPAAAG